MEDGVSKNKEKTTKMYKNVWFTGYGHDGMEKRVLKESLTYKISAWKLRKDSDLYKHMIVTEFAKIRIDTAVGVILLWNHNC